MFACFGGAACGTFLFQPLTQATGGQKSTVRTTSSGSRFSSRVKRFVFSRQRSDFHLDVTTVSGSEAGTPVSPARFDLALTSDYRGITEKDSPRTGLAGDSEAEDFEMAKMAAGVRRCD